MKKLRNLLIVTSLLMVFGFLLPTGQAETKVDEGITLCSDAPPADTFGFR